MNNKTQLQVPDRPQAKPGKVLKVKCKPGEDQALALARSAFSPCANGMLAAHPWTEKAMGDTGVNEAMQVVRQYADEAAAGDLDGAKRMLMSQAVALNAIFTETTRRAADCLQMDDRNQTWTLKGQSMQILMGIAMKAQSQCRTTLEALNELVNPRSVAFIKQANVANGPQQVNNGAAPRAQEASVSTPKLLEEGASERLDFGAQAAAGRADSELATVGAVHGTKDEGGQVHRLPKRAQARVAQR